jgi:hypothetical protein
MAQAKERRQAPGRELREQEKVDREETESPGRRKLEHQHARGNGGGASTRGHSGRSGGGSRGNGRAT